MAIVKTRFAPSPTGLLHLGSIRTTLFNVLLAKHFKGNFLLRIEDTDKERSKEEYTEQLQMDMHWLGLDWQEGPFKQSERQAIYDRYYRILEENNLAYACFCTEQQLALARKVQLSSGKPPRYPGTCRNLTEEQISQKLQQGLKPTLRFAVPLNQKVTFYDLVRGEQHFDTNDLGDFVIRRGDGTSPFLFCNAIDDALMQVTHVLRGEDHLTNTPRQILILQALSLTSPQYGHINLIVGQDGSPLSKRHGSRSVKELREQGFLPAAINNYLARLGHYYEDNSFMSLEQLAEKFSLKNLGRAPAKFDANQLLHWQKEAVLHQPEQELQRWVSNEIYKIVPEKFQPLFLATIKANVLFPNEATHWAKVFYDEEVIFNNEQEKILSDAGTKFFEIALVALNQHGPDFQKISDAIKNDLNVKGKALFQPLRVALTGEVHGPEMVKIFELLGEEKIRQRLKKIVTNL